MLAIMDIEALGSLSPLSVVAMIQSLSDLSHRFLPGRIPGPPVQRPGAQHFACVILVPVPGVLPKWHESRGSHDLLAGVAEDEVDELHGLALGPAGGEHEHVP